MKKFTWNDSRALEFARVSQAGAYGKFRGCHSIESKLKRFKQLVMDNKKTTNTWIIIDEETLQTVKRNDVVLKFDTQELAESYASDRLEIWSTFNVHFDHQWIHHDASQNHK